MGKGKLLHIEGLRGLAIIMVILFHSAAFLMPLGFVGVDVFLVISGYLLFRKPLFDGGKGTWKACCDFVRKKVARLMIPLSIAVLFALICGFLFLTPEDFITGAQTSISALLLASNSYLDACTDSYFGLDSAYNITVHTWYLSVLGQIFILFLLGNLLLQNAPNKLTRWILFLVSILSFLAFHERYITTFMVHEAPNLNPDGSAYPTFSYYSTFPRIWEVLAGAAVAMLPPLQGKKRDTLAVIGILLLIFSVCGLPHTLLGKYAVINEAIMPVIAVAGAVLIIAYATSGIAYHLLSSRALVFIGTISFSLYLVHMPIVAAWRSMIFNRGIPLCCMLWAFIFVVGIAFYFVERHKFSRKSSWAIWITAFTAAIFVSEFRPQLPLWNDSDLIYEKWDNWQYASGNALKEYDARRLNKTDIVGTFAKGSSYKDTPLLYMGDCSKEPSIALFGDCHAAGLFFGFDNFCQAEGLCGIYLTTYVRPGLSPFDNARLREHVWYLEKQEALLKWLRNHPEIKTVVLAELWEPRMKLLGSETVRKFILSLKGTGKQLVIPTPFPVFSGAFSQTMRDYRLGKTRGKIDLGKMTITQDEYYENTKITRAFLQELEAEGLCKVLPIDESLFRNGKFSAYEDGYYMMRDSGHMSVTSSKRAVMGCRDKLRQILNARETGE